MIIKGFRWVYIIGSISKISNLTEAMDHVAEGNLSIRIDTKNAGEFKKVYKQFNDMVQELERTKQEMDGYEFVKEIRSAGDATPVIMLTAMDSFTHKKKGYELGIDEYLTKPINYEELGWHIEAILRRYHINTTKEIAVGAFTMNESTMAVVYDGEEFKLLYKLLLYPGVIFTKQQLMDEIWGYDTETDYNTIKVYVNQLRNKLKDCTEFSIISSRGVGYKAELKD